MQISVEELNNKNKYNTLNIIDIRDNYAYAKSHIINAKNIPKELLVNYTEKYLEKEQKYYIYCQNGITSVNVVNKLNTQGYHTYSLIGGYNNYLLWK